MFLSIEIIGPFTISHGLFQGFDVKNLDLIFMAVSYKTVGEFMCQSFSR